MTINVFQPGLARIRQSVKEDEMKMKIATIILLAICGIAAPSVIASVVVTQRPPTQEARTLGVIDFGDDRTKDVVSAPNTVRVQEEFRVKITIYGGIKSTSSGGIGTAVISAAPIVCGEAAPVGLAGVHRDYGSSVSATKAAVIEIYVLDVSPAAGQVDNTAFRTPVKMTA
jgi:hypothetical protein